MAEFYELVIKWKAIHPVLAINPSKEWWETWIQEGQRRDRENYYIDHNEKSLN